MALKLAAAFKTTADFWLNAQKAVEIYRAFKGAGRLPKPLRKAASILFVGQILLRPGLSLKTARADEGEE